VLYVLFENMCNDKEMLLKEVNAMKYELIYLWINKDKNNCFNQMGFNFSPRFNVSFDYESRSLEVISVDTVNVFEKENLMNLTAIVGENGTGKTTLLKYLTLLSDIPIQDNDDDSYNDWETEQNEFKKFIAIYSEGDEQRKLKIINNTDGDIYYNGEELKAHSVEEYQRDTYIEKISHIYISNSENAGDGTLRSDAIIHTILSNSTIKSIFKEFYSKLYNVHSSMLIKNTRYNALQYILINKMNIQKCQTILDIMYQKYISSNNLNFCGKIIKNIVFSVEYITSMIKLESQSINYSTEYANSKFIKKSYDKMKQEINKVIRNFDIFDIVLYNLIFELVFIFDFQLEGKELSTEDAYEQCCNYINLLDDSEEKAYYVSAIDEINLFKIFLEKAVMNDNSLPKEDLGRECNATISIDDIYQLLAERIESGKSFVLKYLKIINLDMSSGERALMNFMSRIYFASNISKMIPNNHFKLRENVLLLIDEIDLYLHPEWQRQIISDLIKEIRIHFPEYYFQVIITTHSPIVLSDIPCQNTIFLQRDNENIFQLHRSINTFGANIHSLYKDAFFIKNGLAMGQYAQEYIDELIEDIEKDSIDSDEAKKKISIVGEPLIQKKLYKLLRQQQSETVLLGQKEREQIISFLKRQKLDIERQLAVLEYRE